MKINEKIAYHKAKADLFEMIQGRLECAKENAELYRKRYAENPECDFHKDLIEEQEELYIGYNLLLTELLK